MVLTLFSYIGVVAFAGLCWCIMTNRVDDELNESFESVDGGPYRTNGFGDFTPAENRWFISELPTKRRTRG